MSKSKKDDEKTEDEVFLASKEKGISPSDTVLGNEDKKDEERVTKVAEVREKEEEVVREDNSEAVPAPQFAAPTISEDTGTVMIKNKVVSAVEITASNMKHFLTMSYKKSLHIKPWSDINMFYKSLFDFYVTLVNFYDGYITNIPRGGGNTYTQNGTTLTEISAMGVDMPALIPVVHETDRPKINEALKSIDTHKDKVNPLVDHVSVALTDEEWFVQRELSMINKNAGIMDLKTLTDYFELLNNSKNTLSQLDSAILPQYDKIWLEPVTHIYGLFMDTIMKFRQEISLVIRAQTMSFITFKDENQTSFSTLLKNLRVNTNQFSNTASLPISITSGDARDFYQKLLLVLNTNRWNYLTYSFNDQEFDIVTLVEMLVMKLLIPGRALRFNGIKELPEERIIRDIDNYIYKFYISNFKSVRPTRRYDPSVNMLQLVSPRELGANGAAIMAFLRTDDKGAGWASGGVNLSQQNPNPDLHPQATLWRSTYGQAADHDDTMDPFPQLQRFMDFSAALAGVQYSNHRDELEAVNTLMNFLASRSQLIQKYSQFHEVVSKLVGLNPLTATTPDTTHLDRISDGILLSGEKRRELEGYNNMSPIVQRSANEIKKGSVLAAAFNVSFGLPQAFPTDHSVILQGFHIHGQLRLMENLYDLASRMIPKGVKTKSLRISYALDRMNGPVKTILERGLMETERFTIPIVDNTNLWDKVSVINRKLVSGNEHMWGWVTKMVYQGVLETNTPLVNASKLHTLMVPKANNVFIPEKSLHDMVQKETLGNFVRGAVASNASVTFQLPVPIAQGMFSSSQLNQNILDVQDADNKITISPLLVSYIFSDELVRTSSNKFALVGSTQFGTNMVPFKLTTAAELAELVRQVIVDTGLKFHAPSVFKRSFNDRVE
jgi:hypothetical protein